MVGGLLFLVFLTLGSAQTLLSEEKCSLGPSYWCADIGAARECGAVRHCLTTSWKNDPVPEVDVDSCCEKCESVVDQLRNYASLTERDVLILMYTACDAVPFAKQRQQCKDGVQTYVRDIMDMIVNKIDSKKICTLIRLCKKSQKKGQPAHFQQPTFGRVQLHRDEPAPFVAVTSDTETCEVCKLAVKEAHDFIVNADNQKKIVNLLKEEGCSRCPAKQKCEAFIDEYAPFLFTFLVEELKGDELCTLVGLCGKNVHPLTPVFTELINVIKNVARTPVGTACDVCKNSFAKLRSYFADPKVRNSVKDLLKFQLCLLCPAKDKCQADVDKYINKIFASIDNFLAKGGEICQKIGLCPRTQLEKSVEKRVGAVSCTICEFVMRQLDAILGNNRTEEAIRHGLEKVCSYLPATVNDECRGFVDEYTDMIVDLLVKELDPQNVCTALHLCNTKVAVKKDPTLRFSPYLLRGAPMMKAPTRVGAKFGPQCVLCEFIMSKLETLLVKNATEEDILHAVEKVCSLLPAHLSADCKKFMDEYGPAIIKILASELRPRMVCTFLGLCALKPGERLPVSGEFCEVCETAMMYVDSLLKENATEEEVEHLLLKICNYLPEKIRGECNMIVMLYTNEIIELLVNKMSPKFVCTAIKLCAADAKKIQSAVPLLSLRRASRLRPQPSGRLVGADSNKCMYGPSYWCASKENAEKCKMTAHCEEHFWNK